MEKLFIKNRKRQKVCVIVEKPENPKGPDFAKASSGKLAFVMHGRGAFKEQPHLEVIAQTFVSNDYIAVRFDATNGLGESDGLYENAIPTNYYEDLEDVIKWAETQVWYQKPFILVGHSMSGLCVGYFAQNYPNQIKALAFVAPTISGKLSLSRHNPKEVAEWGKTGYKPSTLSRHGEINKTNWPLYKKDIARYDLLPRVKKLTMPVIIVLADKDELIFPEHVKLLFDKLPGKKEMIGVKDAGHDFSSQQNLRDLKQIFDRWIKKLD